MDSIKSLFDPAKYYADRATYERDNVRQLRLDVIAGYGGKCACCKESNNIFLTLDHVNNNGFAERANAAYRRAKRDNFPPDLQILCFNCNCGRARNKGVCPHKAA